ncbi:MAG: 5-formyltetrahydrofolate cyclo-ligase [Sandaracinus sp.]|nr:5-formyltetrahydrofolate cyclo-ligase [Sandaracinus sp.]MCB9617987.1 5-formyltetrahydrofolate cyclo-ligase [Sandaracinus sp.]
MRGTPEDEAAWENHVRQRMKEELRRRMRAVRKGLPREARAERSRKIGERLLEVPELASAKVVAAFVAIHGEVNLAPAVQRLRERGVAIALPRVDLEEQAIVLHAHEPGDVLDESGFGVPEPSPDAPRVDLASVDVVLVPGLAFDPNGFRIGYGKGYYDQLLPTLPNAFRLAVGYDFQLVVEVPSLPHDVPVQAIVTDTRTLRVA